MDFLLIALLTLINGAFAMSEMALTAAKKVRLTAMAESGDDGAKAALELADKPTTMLSTVQIGITSIGMLNGIVGEAAFSDGVQQFLMQLGMGEKLASPTATTLVVIVITFITLIFGELVPKRIGWAYPEAVARVVAKPMLWLAKVASPFVKLLTMSTLGVLKLLRIRTDQSRSVTEAEIAASLDEGLDAGVIEEHERQMVQNLFHLDDRPLISIMIPRSDIEWLDADCSVQDALRKAGGTADTNSKTSHSWYPVCQGGLDNIVGIVSVARLLRQQTGNTGQTVGELATPAVFIPETLSGMELLEQFRQQSARLVFVVDEYGVCQGLLTPRDLLEAITGELKPQVAADAWATREADGAWKLDGLMPVAELKSRLDIEEELPDEEEGHYNTLAGLLMAVAGHLPAQGEAIEVGGWRFEVTALEGRRVDRVRARKIALA
ncbi:hemolysin family protein [Variovorax sp. PCZ-1]|uniref:hemolysin family protein n=1 Tax=Variovorax sp. PCZ-1 TaxID=2835533 RepID=UPI001BCB631D|nr:hemolysin family protein [Variovorax sp. PCZ-1]MBS7806567.1 HlyC/CorC family transporter [Variovorax sp. PCZ-1]